MKNKVTILLTNEEEIIYRGLEDEQFDISETVVLFITEKNNKEIVEIYPLTNVIKITVEEEL